MLKTLFGNQNIEHILFFLFVNERCYGTQLQSLLNTPLTPIQRALSRLEKEGILISNYQGKIRYYELSPTHPLRWELESLLKKAYTLLPTEKKRMYCFLHKKKLSAYHEWKTEKNRKQRLMAFWERLLKVEKLSLISKSRSEEKSSFRTGKAKVHLTMPSPNTLIFKESGVWYVDQNPHTSFTNIFRWNLDLKSSLITLEHLRHGTDRPVFLFHLTTVKFNTLESVGAHLCGEDTYLGNLIWSPKQVTLNWRTIGPNHNSELIYHYS